MSPLAAKCSLCLFPLLVHVSESSDVPDHCRVFALKDPTDRDYQSQCSHEHRPYCDKCDDLTKTIDDITAAIEALAADLVSWKAHLLR